MTRRMDRLRDARARYWKRFLAGDATARRRHELAHLLLARVRMREYAAAKRGTR